MTALIGFALPEGFGKPELLLAIVGGAALGAFASGLLAQLLTRWLTARKLPHLATMVVRVLGGVVVGLLTAMWVWQGGGWGPGGPGGPGGPNGTAPGDANTNPDKGPPKTTPDQPAVKDKTPTPKESVLRLEVLTHEAVARLAGPQAVEDRRYYRVEGETGAGDLHTLAEMKERIRKRLGEPPPLTEVDIVTKPDSPGVGTGPVTDLQSVIHDLKPDLEVKYPSQ